MWTSKFQPPDRWSLVPLIGHVQLIFSVSETFTWLGSFFTFPSLVKLGEPIAALQGLFCNTSKLISHKYKINHLGDEEEEEQHIYRGKKQPLQQGEIIEPLNSRRKNMYKELTREEEEEGQRRGRREEAKSGVGEVAKERTEKSGGWRVHYIGKCESVRMWMAGIIFENCLHHFYRTIFYFLFFGLKEKEKEKY